MVIQYAYDANQWLSVMGVLVDEWVCDCREGIAGQLVTQQARERSDLAMTKHRQAALDRDQRAATGMSARQIYS